MKVLKRPKIPKTLARDAKTLTTELKRKRKNGATTFSYDSSIYAAVDVRSALRTMHKGKCAFCESSLPQLTAGHVEHFRPKGAVQQDIGDPIITPGYYWLGYEWTNLLLACEWCNCRAKRKLFPILNPNKRIRSPRGNLAAEAPLLLNPAEVNPNDHLEFIEEIVKPKNGSKVGETSIRIYRLDDLGLTEERRTKLSLFRILKILAANARPTKEAKEALAEVVIWNKKIRKGEIEYSAMLSTNL